MTISISATAVSGYIPLTVGFSFTAENPPESIEWNFGDGETSTDEAPNHTYENEGTYTVTLTAVTGEDTDTANIVITVSIPQPATVSISASETTAYAPVMVQFSSTVEGGEPQDYEYEWNFGNGETSTHPNPSHTYAEAGTYTVTLTVRNNAGQTEAEPAQITVVVKESIPATVSISANAENTYAPARIQFSSTVEGGEPQDYEYEWEFGDGETDTQPTPEHIFAEAGTYTVTLTVKNNAGQTESEPAQFTIEILNPTYPQINISAQQTGGLTVKFDNKTEYIDIQPESVTWSFGDGTTAEATAPADMAAQTHVYTYSGIYQCLITFNYPNGYFESKPFMAVLYSGNIIPKGISQNGQQKRRAGV